MGLLDSFTGGQGGGPMDYLRGRVSSWQAHPFQNIASTLAGVAGGPMAGLGANAAFNRYNDNQFNNSAQQFQDLTRDQSNLDTNAAMNKPLNGPLGAYDRSHPYGDPQMGSMGGAGGMSSPGGYSGGGQNWNLGEMTSGHAPSQPSSFVNDILNSISTGPGQPGTQQGGLFDQGGGNQGPGALRDGTMGNRGANYGVSNMVANGQQMITGMDPNQMVMANGRRNMY